MEANTTKRLEMVPVRACRIRVLPAVETGDSWGIVEWEVLRRT